MGKQTNNELCALEKRSKGKLVMEWKEGVRNIMRVRAIEEECRNHFLNNFSN